MGSGYSVNSLTPESYGSNFESIFFNPVMICQRAVILFEGDCLGTSLMNSQHWIR